jgi:SAM-dependent methyltransferase
VGWYERAFGPFYPLVYAHRDEAEAQRTAALVVPLLPRGAVLDLACGTGRHAAALAAAGVSVVGIDLSADLLRLAAERSPRLRLVRADMRRLPLRRGAFAAVLSLFTSFGYFDTDDENRAVLAEAERVLGVGGVLVLDTPNPPAARAGAGRSSARDAGAHRVIEERAAPTAGAARLEKRVRIVSRADGREVESYVESVRLYERDEIEGILRGLGFGIIRVWGDYLGGPLGEASPRMIVAARKGAAPACGSPGAEQEEGR